MRRLSYGILKKKKMTVSTWSKNNIMVSIKNIYSVESLEFMVAQFLWYSWVALSKNKFRVIFLTENRRMHKITSHE